MAMAAGAAVGRGGGGTDEYDDDEDHGSTGPDVEKASSAAMSSSPKKGFVDSTGGRLTMVGPDCLSLLLVVVLLLFRLPFMMLGGREEWESFRVVIRCV
jgi:hypothetical protein